MKKLLQWPKTGTLDASPLLDPIMRAIERSHHIECNGDEPEYDGYEIGYKELAHTESPSEFTAKFLNEQHKKHGESPLFRWVLVAFQLGVEQGRRCKHEDNGDWKQMYRDLKAQVERDKLQTWKDVIGPLARDVANAESAGCTAAVHGDGYDVKCETGKIIACARKLRRSIEALDEQIKEEKRKS